MEAQDFELGFHKPVPYLYLNGQNSEKPAWTPLWDLRGDTECGPSNTKWRICVDLLFLPISSSCTKAKIKEEKGASSFGATVADYKERVSQITITPERVAKVL